MERDTTPTPLEDPAGLRHHLLRLGIDFPGDPHRRAGGPTAPVCRNALLCRRHRSLRLDARHGHSLTQPPRMGLTNIARDADLSGGLRIGLLGRATRAFRHNGGHAGHHPGFHRAARDSDSAHPEVNPPLRMRPRSRPRWSRRPGQPLGRFRGRSRSKSQERSPW